MNHDMILFACGSMHLGPEILFAFSALVSLLVSGVVLLANFLSAILLRDSDQRFLHCAFNFLWGTAGAILYLIARWGNKGSWWQNGGFWWAVLFAHLLSIAIVCHCFHLIRLHRRHRENSVSAMGNR